MGDFSEEFGQDTMEFLNKQLYQEKTEKKRVLRSQGKLGFVNVKNII